jgi:hypothetical protein
MFSDLFSETAITKHRKPESLLQRSMNRAANPLTIQCCGLGFGKSG